MNKIIFSDKEIVNIIDLYVNQRISLKNIGKIFKCGKHVIKRILIDKGISILDNSSNFKVEFTKEEIDSIILEYESGASCRFLAKKYNCLPRRISLILRKLNIMNNKLNLLKVKISLEEMQKVKYGSLTVLKENSILDNHCQRTFVCSCDCGNIVTRAFSSLRHGDSKTCGDKSVHYIGENNKNYIGYKIISGATMHKIRKSAKKREIEFDITAKYLCGLFEKQNGCCALSNLEIFLPTNRKNFNGFSASLDRIDSSKGYIEGNVQWVHKDINFMKLDFDQKLFLTYCKKITEHQTNQSSDNSLD